MRSRWGAAGALVVGLVGAAPLARVPFFASDDGLVHLWRVWEYARVAAATGFPVRWAPDAAYGFGTPVFTFYNPLAYVVATLPVLAGTTAADATKLVFALSLVLSALGAYAFAAAWNPRAPQAAGLTAALLYTLVPYRLATVYERGALAEALGLALAPWAVLAAVRVASPLPLGEGQGEGASPRVGLSRAAPLALATGALILAHTISALLTLPFALGLGLARLLERPTGERPRGLVVLAVGFALGAALGALYWLPAFAQQGSVHLDRARFTEVGGGFLGSFQWPWQLVQPTLLHDYASDVAAARPAPDRFPRVPVVAAVALGLGLVAGLRRGDLRRPTGLIVLLGLVVALALATPPARPLWSTVSLLASVQLGWRFLAVLLVMAIPLAASLPDLLPRGGSALALGLALAVGADSLAHLPVEPLPWSAARERPAELASFERKTGEFALGALREYVPRGADATPEQLALEPADPAGWSAADVDVRLVAAGLLTRRYEVATSVPTSVVFDVLDHPSVAVRLDGAASPPHPVGDDGLVAVDIPRGPHTLELTIGETTVERLADWTSLGALAAALALAASAWPRRRTLLVASPAFLSAAIAVFALLPTSASASAPAPLIPPRPIPLGGARLLGASVDPSLVDRLGVLTVDLHLQSTAAFDRNEPLTLRLVGPAGTIVESVGGPADGLRPTSRWRPNELLRAREELRLPAGLPAGPYSLEVEMRGQAGRLGPTNLPTAGAVPLADLTEPSARFESIFGDQLVLDGYTYDPSATARPLRGSFWWRRPVDGAALYDATLRLVDKQGNVLAEDTQRTGGAGAVRPETDFVLQPTAPPRTESYRLELLVRPVGAAPLPAKTFSGSPNDALVLTWFDVPEPCRCLPVDATPLQATFADGISLAGWRLGQTSPDVDLSLYWRADARPSRDYVVSLRLLDGDRVVAQIDDMPNGGHRPTAAWQPGDVVPDRYRLRSSSGGATAVEVGLYRPDTKERLPLVPPTAANTVVLPLPASAP